MMYWNKINENTTQTMENLFFSKWAAVKSKHTRVSFFPSYLLLFHCFSPRFSHSPSLSLALLVYALSSLCCVYRCQFSTLLKHWKYRTHTLYAMQWRKPTLCRIGEYTNDPWLCAPPPPPPPPTHRPPLFFRHLSSLFVKCKRPSFAICSRWASDFKWKMHAIFHRQLQKIF